MFSRFCFCLLAVLIGFQEGISNHEKGQTEEAINNHDFHLEDTLTEDKSGNKIAGLDSEQSCKSDTENNCDEVQNKHVVDGTVQGDTETWTVEDSQGTTVSKNENGDFTENTTPETSETVEAQASNRTNRTFLQWLRFVVEPLLEEFRDGIYPKLTEKTNVTSNTTSASSENDTVNLEEPNNSTVLSNATETESGNSTDSSKKVKFQCTGRNVTDNVNATVKLITSARLLQLLNFEKNDTENITDCLLVMFFAPWCHFCAKVAPHYNALARAFPQLDFVAVDTAQFSNLLARFGTVSVPNILVFHQSRAAVKFNQTERTFENFVSFIRNTTGLEPNASVNVTEADYEGPIPSVPTNEPDYLLLISWIFVIFCSTCMFVKSNRGQQWINRVRVLWQEHQHQHVD